MKGQTTNMLNQNSSYLPNKHYMDMNLNELQEIAVRQLQQIEINQQLLLAKEKRLRYLKLEEEKNNQLCLLSTQNNLIPSQSLNTNSRNLLNNDDNQFKLENLKQNVLGQELKIFKLKQLRNQILEKKLSNSNMYSELDLIKNLFAEKERDLYKAVTKVAELTKQIDQLRKIKSMNTNQQNSQQNDPNQPQQAQILLNASELEKLKQELQIRNKLNEQQSKKILQQHEQFHQKQLEVLALDKRIEELQNRIASKRRINEQISLKINNRLELNDNNSPSNNQAYSNQIQMQRQQMFQKENNMINQNKSNLVNTKHTSNGIVLENIANNPAQAQLINEQIQNGSNLSSSPSKVLAKFATKQEIANTYMNKYGSEAYQRYQQASIQLLQQQNQNNIFNQSLSPPGHNNSNLNANNHVKQLSNDENSIEQQSTNTLPSTSSSITSLSPNSQGKNLINEKEINMKKANDFMPNNPISNVPNEFNSPNNQVNNISTELSSHLRLEFDKIKYLPDMVKTIKKRHSISEIEGSTHTIPPQIFQKVLEKHHQNFLDQHQQQQSQMQKLNQINSRQMINDQKAYLISNQSQPSLSSKANNPEQDFSNENEYDYNELSQMSYNPDFDRNFEMISNNKPQYSHNVHGNSYLTSEQSELNNIKEETNLEVIETCTISSKSTKPIIKQFVYQSNFSNEDDKNVRQLSHNKRVNFDPHALLLDAAVEGELDLVIKCAKLVKDVSEPNDEGITALHNSVCAGHFDIVKFLVEFGCDINYADNDGWTPLHCAASCNNLPMVKFLIENGASVYATTVSDNETAIKKCEEDEDGYEACFEYLQSVQRNLGDLGYNNGIVHALYNYESQNEDELSFKTFDKLVVIDKHENEDRGDANDGWWTAKLLNENRQGLVPRNYLGLYSRNQPSSKNQETTVC